MKALSVKNPWAALIASGDKTMEVRSWRTHYRGPLMIVSTQRPDTRSHLVGDHAGLACSAPCGVSLCIVDVVDCIPGETSHAAHTGGIDPTGNHCWVFANSRRVDPVAAKGKLGLWDWQPSLWQAATRPDAGPSPRRNIHRPHLVVRPIP